MSDLAHLKQEFDNFVEKSNEFLSTDLKNKRDAMMATFVHPDGKEESEEFYHFAINMIARFEHIQEKRDNGATNADLYEVLLDIKDMIAFFMQSNNR